MEPMELDDHARGAGRNKNYDHIQLPGKENAGNEPIGYRVTTTLNAFKFDTSKADFGHKHDLTFVAKTAKKEFTVHTKGGREDAVKGLRHRVLKKLLNVMFEQEKDRLGGGDGNIRQYGFDNGAALYAPVKLDSFQGDIPLENLPEEVKTLVGGVQSVAYYLNHVEEISLKGTDVVDRSALQLIEVVSSMKLDDVRHLQFDNKAYYTSSSHPEEAMVGAKVIKNGFAKSIRPIGADLTMQIDGKVSPFFKGGPLMSFCEEFGGKIDKMNRALENQIKNLIVTTTHLPTNRLFQIKGLYKLNADQLTFDYTNEAGEKDIISVTDYFNEKYHRKLKHSNLPLVEERKGQKASYHPIEVLSIVPGQRVSNQKSSGAMIADLIKRAQKKPDALFRAIDEQAYRAFIDGSKHEQLDAFKMKASCTRVTAKADILFPPTISTQMGVCQPDMKFAEKWKMNARERFLEPAKNTGNMMCIIFDGVYTKDSAQRAIATLFQAGYDKGMDLDKHKVSYETMNSSQEQLREFMSRMRGVQAVIGFTRDNTDEVHGDLKLCEAETGIVTLHCTKKVIDQVLEGKPLACGNILNKFNQKLGGSNFRIGAPKELKSHAPILDAKSKTWFGKTRMFVGLSISHAGPQSFADRSSGVKQSEPSVVGISHTTTGPTKQDGWYFMQEPGEVLILDMTKHIMRALKNFHNATGALPTDITVYRSGKSEGEFKALSTESDQFYAAFDKMQAGYRPTLTILVVCVGSLYRMAIQTGPNRYDLENVAPGTCLTAEGCNPFFKEFVIGSQRALQGTLRPNRCNVVFEKEGKVGKKLSIDELKLITNSLSYATGIVTAPIALPAPLDSADKLANRGRNNYKAKMNAFDDCSTVSSGPPRELAHDGTENFFEKLSLTMETKVKNRHFWA